MGKKLEQAERLSHDFNAASEAELEAQIAAFKTAYTAEHGRLLAMDARRSLGAGKVRVTFRVRDAAKRV